MDYRKNDEIELVITDMGTDGEGIGRAEPAGIPFFVNGAVTGDRIRAGIMKLKSNLGYARILEILEPSPWRVTSRCPIAAKCGGCQLQQLDYTKQLEYKQNKVKNCLERIGGLKNIPFEPITGMQEPWYYRNKAQFPVSRGKDGSVQIGFYAGHSHNVIDTEHCFIQAHIMQPLVETIRGFLQEKNISIYDEETGKGLVRHLLLRVGFATGEIMVCLILNGDKLPHSEVLIAGLKKTVADALPVQKNSPKYQLQSVMINTNRANTNVILGNQNHLLYGREYITDRIGDVSYRISAQSFYQVNPVQTKVIYDTVKEFSALTGQEIVWDLYCGTGTIGLYLAQQARMVYGVEIVPQAIEDAKENAAANGITNAAFFAGAAEALAENLLQQGKPDIIIVDPPRKGCDQTLLNTILRAAPERIVYVSCDPATLARDLKVLTAGEYELKAVRPVDAFCHSTHVETVCLMLRK